MPATDDREVALVSGNELDVVAALERTLRRAAFGGSSGAGPRNASRHARAVFAAFTRAVDEADPSHAERCGDELACNGIAPRGVLEVSEILRQASQGGASAPRLVTALLEGYILARERELLREQERTREALVRSIDRES